LHGCLIEGNACGALSTLQVGGTGGQPDLARLSSFLSRNGRRVDVRRVSRAAKTQVGETHE
jgi:hypothetical protein